MRLTRRSTPCAAVHTVGVRPGDQPRERARAPLAGAVLLVAALAGLSLTTSAHATTFPGDNGRVAGSGPISTHADSASGSKLELFTIKSLFSNPAAPPADECKLTDNANSDFNPRFSKDGTKVVYVKDNNLWTLKVDATTGCAVAGSEKQLTGPPQNVVTEQAGGLDSFVGGWCTKPAAGSTPEQEWVVFQRSTVALSFEVYKVQVDSNRNPVGLEQNLTLDPANDSQPSVTPDCSKIAFHSNRRLVVTARNSDVWVMNFDGSLPVNRTACSNAQESAPSWSPDGNRIAFQTNRNARTDGRVDLEIYRMDEPVGDNCSGSATRLSYSAPSGDGSGLDLTGYDLNPSYSPDGKRICFHSGRAAEFRNTGASGVIGQWEIYTLDAELGETGSAVTERLTNRAGNDERCGWQEKP